MTERMLTVTISLNSNKTSKSVRERGGIVVEHRTPNREVLGLIPTGGTMLSP